MNPAVRRYIGVGVVAAGAGGVLLSQALSAGIAAPVARCAAGHAGAIGLAVPQTLQANQDNEVRATIAACDSQGVGDLVLLVSAPVAAGATPAFPTDLDVADVGGCERDHVADRSVVYLCGAVAAHESRTVSIKVVPRRVSGTNDRLAVTAVDVAAGGFEQPRLLDATAADLRFGSTSSTWPLWPPWVLVGVALLGGVDMARRSRSGFRWALGLLAFNVLGWMVWIRDRALWQVVPAGSPPAPAVERAWVRRYSLAAGIAVPVLIVAFIVAGAVGSVAGGHSSGGGPAAVASPPAPPGGVAGATPCAGGTLPASVSTATRIVLICGGAPPDPVALHPGDTLGLVLPSGARAGDGAVEPETIATLDRRHFAVVRPTHAAAFHLVP